MLVNHHAVCSKARFPPLHRLIKFLAFHLKLTYQSFKLLLIYLEETSTLHRLPKEPLLLLEDSSKRTIGRRLLYFLVPKQSSYFYRQLQKVDY